MYLKIRTKYTIFMHIKKKKKIRGDPHSQEGIKTECYLNAHLKSIVVDKGSFEKKSIFWVVEMLINMCSECTILM